jgi:ferric-dicitrate binding protein FerR (iron transport regulator)
MKEQIPSFKEMVEDESFIRWVKHNSWQDAAFWEEKMKQHPEITEDTLAARQFIEYLHQKDIAVEKDYLDGIWKKIDETTGESKKIRRHKFLSLYAASAASVLLLLIFGFYPQKKTYQAQRGEIITLTLPDHSKVTLNAATEMVYTGNRFQTLRKVRLSGEAFFRVTKGSTFRVLTKEGTITVLGTSFNVKSREEKLTVHCLTGKVKVSDAFKAVYLTRGKKTGKFKDEPLQDAQSDTQFEGINWQNGNFYFQNTYLGEVLAELSRQYNVAIRVPATEEKRIITASFDNKNINTALLNVLWPLNLKAEEKDGIYIIQKTNSESE